MKIKEVIGIIKFDGTNILIDTNNKLEEYITLKNIAILITCIIKGEGKFYFLIKYGIQQDDGISDFQEKRNRTNFC